MSTAKARHWWRDSFERCPSCLEPKHEHEWPYGCSRCSCEQTWWGFPEGHDRWRPEDA